MVIQLRAHPDQAVGTARKPAIEFVLRITVAQLCQSMLKLLAKLNGILLGLKKRFGLQLGADFQITLERVE